MISLGNLCFGVGAALIAGVPRTIRFLVSRRRRKGSLVLILGIILVAGKFGVTGTIVEMTGLVLVFASSAGLIITFLRNMPIIGPILDSPQLQPLVLKLGSGSILPT